MDTAQTLYHTPLYQAHQALAAKLVPFAGWEMPLQYSGILAEVRAVRTTCGAFDISHMGRLHLTGPGAAGLLDWVLTAPVRQMGLYRARYTLLCTEEGGIIDDGIVYRLGDEHFLLVANAASRETVVGWLRRWATKFGPVELEDRTLETAMIAFQGPLTPMLLEGLAQGEPSALRPFRCQRDLLAGIEALVARTGYTGEDGFELIIDAQHAEQVWRELLKQGATPCGLGARDLLRLEAGMLLYGTDMDTAVNPLEAGLGNFVRLDERDFCGAAAIRRAQEEGPQRRLVGFQMVERGIPRHGHPLLDGQRAIGQVTSGNYSPTLDRGIGLGYVPDAYTVSGTRIAVDIRGRPVEAEVVRLPFYSRRSTP